MARIRNVILKDAEVTPGVEALIREGIVASFKSGAQVLIARHGTNKTTLKKLMKGYLGQ